MISHPIVIGYGSIGRSAAGAIDDVGSGSDLVVIDQDPARVAVARRDGAHPVLGDACDLDVLRRAGTSEATSVTIAVAADSDAVRITSAVRGLNSHAAICTSLRSGGWRAVAQHLGADQVVVTSRIAGRLLGLSTRRPGLLGEFQRALRHPPEIVVAQRPVRAGEIGQHPTHCSPLVLAVVRCGRIRWRDDPETPTLRARDQLLVIRALWPTS
ncbi:NAD(P)-binding protein [Nocardia sp. NPDC052316]|uniref:NAD(P)-binding protein n=1 Tax=Nocardia sp. NPDC052316 TaxID=3364329 RepID=UPI0037CA3D0D